MSKTIRQTALSGLLGSKRFIVAVCAAIAMVLGAMSVGASIFVPGNPPEGQQAANASIFDEASGDNSKTDASRSGGGTFTRQNPLAPNEIAVQQPSPTPSIAIPKSRVNLGIEFGPVKTDAGLTLGGLQVRVETPGALAPVIETPVLPSLPIIETPAEEEQPKTDPSTEENPAEEPTSPGEDDASSPVSGSFSTFSDTPSTPLGP